MTYINEDLNQSLNLINQLAFSIESRRELIISFKNSYLSLNQNEICLKKNILEDILDEFEFTISQSIQAIRTMQLEFENIYEENNCKNKIKKFPEFMQTKQITENKDKNIQNYSSNGDFSNLQNHQYSIYNNNSNNFQTPYISQDTGIHKFEEMSFSPGTNRESINFIETQREKDEKNSTGKFLNKEGKLHNNDDENSHSKIENNFKNKKKIDNDKKDFIDNHHCTSEEKYNFERAYDNLYNIESDFEDKKIRGENNNISMPQQSLIYHRTTNLQSFRGVNSNSNHSNLNNMNNNLQNLTQENKISHSIIEEKLPENSRSFDYLNGLNLNFDYSTISDYKNFIHTGANTINSIEYNNPIDHDLECKTINYSENNIQSNYALEYDQSPIVKDHSPYKYDQNLIHFKNKKFETLSSNFPKGSFKTIDSNQEENSDFKISKEQKTFSPLIIPKEDLVEDHVKKLETCIKQINNSNQKSLNNSYTLSVKQGLRQKLKQGGRSSEQSGQSTPKTGKYLGTTIEFDNKLKTLQNSNSFYNLNLLPQQLERNHRTNRNTVGYKFETESDFNPCDEQRKDTLNAENSVPKISSKQDAFKSRIQDVEKEIVISNIIKRIDRNENFKQFLSRQYGNGSFDDFVKRIYNNEINLERIQADLNFETFEGASKAKTSTVNSSFNKNLNSECIQSKSLIDEDGQKLLNNQISPTRPRSAVAHKNYKSKSKRDILPTATNPSPYTGPIKFENFLRNPRVSSKPKSLTNSEQRKGNNVSNLSLENKKYNFPNTNI